MGRTNSGTPRPCALPNVLPRPGLKHCPRRYEAGKVSAETGSIPINTQLMIIVFAFHFVESKRKQVRAAGGLRRGRAAARSGAAGVVRQELQGVRTLASPL